MTAEAAKEVEEILPEVVILTLMEEEKPEQVEKRIEEVELKSQKEEEEVY